MRMKTMKTMTKSLLLAIYTYFTTLTEPQRNLWLSGVIAVYLLLTMYLVVTQLLLFNSAALLAGVLYYAFKQYQLGKK